MWDLQFCVIGCDTTLTTFAQPGLYLLHIIDRPAGVLAEALTTLADTPDGPDVLYGGELVAMFEVEVGEDRVRSQEEPWGIGTAVYVVESTEEARALLTDEAFAEFRSGTTDDMLAVLETTG